MGAVWRQSVMYSTSSYHQGMSGDRPNALGLSDGPGMLRAQGRCGLGESWCRLVGTKKKKFIEYRSTYDRGPPSHASWQDRLSRLRAPP